MSAAPELTPIREKHRFDEAALGRYLGSRLEGDFSDLSVLQFEGGQSNPTFLFSAGEDRYVLRKKPPGKLLKSAHAVDREYRVMTALQSTRVPVPRTHLLCEDETVIGTPFFLMEYVEGRVFIDQRLPALGAEERAAIYDHFAEVLAALHKVDFRAVGLEEFGRPGNYFARQISRWSKQYRASETEEIPAMDSLMDWLPANIPQSDEPSLVHGDYRIGNCIIHPSEPRIVALLDWELSTIGHALGDLAYCCVGYHHSRAEADRLGPATPGIPAEADFLKRYCELAGRGPIDNWTFYIAYNLFRSAAITQGVYKRGLDGIASSEQWKERSGHTRESAERGWQLARERSS